MRKKFLLAGVASSLLLVGALVPLLRPRHCPVTKEAYDRIEEGMSRAQVEAILGGPPRDYRNQPTQMGWSTRVEVERSGPYLPDAREADWFGDEGDVCVWFAPDGRVSCKAYIGTEPVGGPLETLRWRLSRRWDRLWGR